MGLLAQIFQDMLLCLERFRVTIIPGEAIIIAPRVRDKHISTCSLTLSHARLRLNASLAGS